MIDKTLLEGVINEGGSVIAIYSDKWGGNRCFFTPAEWVSVNSSYHYSVYEVKMVDVDKDCIYCIVTVPNSKNQTLTGLFMEVRYSNYLVYSRDKILKSLLDEKVEV
jgi:hypothetical protein